MPIDIILDDDDDLLVKDGDFVLGECTDQEIYLIVKSEPGMWRDNILLGFGAAKRMKTVLDKLKFKKDLDTHLRLDKYTNTSIIMNNDGVQSITATR